MSVSVKDVSVEAGVSLGTVSNVLNRPDKVRATTRDRVERAMRELGFVRNESARQLRAGRGSSIGYVMLDGSNPFFTDVAAGMERAAEVAGLSLFLCNSDQRPESERDYLSRLEQLRVQGILITPVDPGSAVLDQLQLRGIPVVVVDRSRPHSNCCTVAVDDVLGGRLAAEHLLDLGHERIAFVGGPDRIGQVRDRKEGVRAGLAAAGRPVQPLVDVHTQGLSIDEGMNATERIAGMAAAERPTAVFCANDMLALGVLQRCVALGLRVPDDLALVGYDDIVFAAAAAVPLTSVRQPRREMGRVAAELLVDEATDPEHRHEQILFEPELVARASTRGARP